MITVTDNAVRQLRALLDGRPDAEEKGLRVGIAKGGCSGLQYEMALDQKRDDDAVVEQDGVQFLVDAESAAYLEGEYGVNGLYVGVPCKLGAKGLDAD